MTHKELSQLYHLKKEIDEDREKLKQLKAKAYNARSANLTGLPGCGDGRGSNTERYALAIQELESIIEDKMQRCMDAVHTCENFISSIPDSHTRRLFSLRFVEGLSWQKVANIIGGNNTADSARMAVFRYLRK